MTDYTPEALEALSKAAASGTLTHAGWGDGSTQMGMTNIFNEDHEVCLMECIPEEDAAFICALWNAYRTGQLIHAVPSGDEVEAVAGLKDPVRPYRNLIAETLVSELDAVRGKQ